MKKLKGKVPKGKLPRRRNRRTTRSAPRAEDLLALKRRATIVKKSSEGQTQQAIADFLGMHRSSVGAALLAHHKAVSDALIDHTQELKAAHHERYEQLIQDAWAEWERSKLPAEKRSTKSIPSRSQRKSVTLEETASVEGRIGDAAILGRILDCMKAQRALWGLDAPQKIAATDPSGQPVVPLSAEELEFRLSKLIEFRKKYPDVVIDVTPKKVLTA